MKVIIAGGGTGGHLFPGIALAEALVERGISSKDEIFFVGTVYGIEARVIPKESYPLRFIRSYGMVGKSFFGKLKAFLFTFFGVIDSFRLLRIIKPQIVIGVGGYASFSTVFTARLIGIPTTILEQNSYPGLANKILGRFVDAIAVTYQESIAYFPSHKTYLTGNPVRKNIIFKDKRLACSAFALDHGRFTILIFGGSSGASSINRALGGALNYLVDLRQNIQLIHQTGFADYDFIKEVYRELGFKAFVAPFIYKMAEAYCAADLVVCRAGATTLAELTAVGKPAILIPYPYAAGNHQELNARKLADMGAAKLILDRELNGDILAKVLRELYNDDHLRSQMQKMSAAFGKLNAADKIIDILLSLKKTEG
ncbi:MAG: undecaprenyldiphospho-muramoylpentapeptide beta-N-acetylglucosaminyltransferase [Thermodesulfovibrionales bacterium]|nr:undecaprenyldiphospho-muramoylpentapeptide beta-N-acetylglucosaminyltransferase [Thermodesulfovibrionales bacterium]